VSTRYACFCRPLHVIDWTLRRNDICHRKLPVTASGYYDVVHMRDPRSSTYRWLGCVVNYVRISAISLTRYPKRQESTVDRTKHQSCSPTLTDQRDYVPLPYHRIRLEQCTRDADVRIILDVCHRSVGRLNLLNGSGILLLTISFRHKRRLSLSINVNFLYHLQRYTITIGHV
jgi:hypothetical protein